MPFSQAHQTLHGACRGRGRRKNIRHLQRALGGLEEDGRWAAREALDFGGSYGPDRHSLRLRTILRGPLDGVRGELNVTNAETEEWTERISGRIPQTLRDGAEAVGH
jgi:hypothetical protein